MRLLHLYADDVVLRFTERALELVGGRHGDIPVGLRKLLHIPKISIEISARLIAASLTLPAIARPHEFASCHLLPNKCRR